VFRLAGLLCLLGLGAFAQPSPLLQILGEELDRNFRILKEKAESPPYFLVYGVTEHQVVGVSASLGALENATRRHSRFLDVSVRVGSYKLDNYHPLTGEQAQFSPGALLPLEDSPRAIQQRLWRETDRAFRAAAQRLIRIRTGKEVKVAESEQAADFSMEQPSNHQDPAPALRISVEDWSERARKLSTEFRKHPEILSSQVIFLANAETKYLVNTEGSRLEHGRTFGRILISAEAKAADGMELSAGETIEAADPAHLPNDDGVRAAIRRVIEELTGMLRAPVVEPYVGPALLSGKAAGVFFHEIFGHRVEGHRQREESDGQTFAKSVGTAVLPSFLSVAFDPTLRSVGKTDLEGSYLYDDDGVKARRVNVVESGILKTFLMSRSPVAKLESSNGHGRRQPGREVVSRQSNLVVESSNKVAEARLRQMLIEEARRQGKPYGYRFEQVTGGYTSTSRRGIQAFKVIPVVVYRVWADGRPDELVRGVEIVGTPLASFAKILATGDKQDVFNGRCGAESGEVPVSAVSPALLVSELEIQKKEVSRNRPPILPPPQPTEGPR